MAPGATDAVADNQISRHQDVFRYVALGADDLLRQFFQGPPADLMGREHRRAST
ncbi:MAG: hypothetical protein LBT16_07160 [Treponema sp.]|nr:hypothetical protein [Treponema sp.]